MNALSIIAIIGGLLILLAAVILVARLFSVDALIRTKFWKSKLMGFSDLLLYDTMIDDGVLLCKNGALMSAWVYEGEDAESTTDEQKTAVMQWVNDALRQLGNGYILNFDAVRKHAPSYSDPLHSHFPDEVSAGIDQERRGLFRSLGTLFEGKFVLTLTWFPPPVLQQKFVDLMYDDDAEKKTPKEQMLDILQTFKQATVNFESSLSLAFKLKRLGIRSEVEEDGNTAVYDDFLSWLHYCVTGIDQPIRAPVDGALPSDHLIGGQEYHHGHIGKMGKNFVAVVAIEGLPLECFPGMLTVLGEMPLQYRWSSRFIYMDEHESVTNITKLQSKWKQKSRGLMAQLFNMESSSVNQDAVSMVIDAEEMLGEIQSGLVASGNYTSVIVLMDESREMVERAALNLKKTLSGLGFASRIETNNTTEAFIGSFPGDPITNVRRSIIQTLNLACFLPVSTVWTGDNKAPCPMYPPLAPPLMQCVTSSRTPFWFNIHNRDLGHTMILGPTGAGKSVLLATMAAQFRRYQDMSVYAFDKGMSMFTLCKAVQGDHYAIAADDAGLSFCPLKYLDDENDRAWAAQWIDTLLALNNLQTTPAQRNAITKALRDMAAETSGRSLSVFESFIQDPEVRTALREYSEGSLSHLLGGETDNLSLSKFTVFEIEELMQGSGDAANRRSLPVLLYLFRRIERSLKGQPTVIFLDEAWLMLGHPVFRSKLVEWLKVLRKANCSVVLATQSLSDAANSGILDVLVESTATKVFLPNIYARDEVYSALYERMGLNTRQIEIVATSRPKQHYYFVSEKGRRLFELALGKFTLSFVAVSDKENIAIVNKLIAEKGDDWVDYWLQMRGVSWPEGLMRKERA